jgi:hypothetical protein
MVAALFALSACLGVVACGDDSGNGSSASNGSPTYHAAHAPAPSTGAPPWPAPPDPLALTREAGLQPERVEQLKYHVHAHLDVFVNGKGVKVPAGIGINIDDPGVKSSPGPISPLHTHDTTGILHTESPTVTPNRLGQFFTEWDVRLSRSCVGGFCRPEAPIAFFINGRRYTGDPRAIGLADQREIAIVIGSPPAKIPATADFSAA